LGFTIISSVTLVCIRWCTPEDKPRGIKEQQNDVNWKDGLRLLFGNLQMLAVFSLVVVCGYSLSFLQNYVYINMHGSTKRSIKRILPAGTRVFSELPLRLEGWRRTGSVGSRQ
jgi:hypothetical protein